MQYLSQVAGDSGQTMQVEILDQAVIKAYEDFPRQLNSSLNRSFKAIGTNFGRYFANSRLSGGGGIQIRRMSASKSRAGQPSLPKKMRAAGFKAEIRGREAIMGKEMSIRTRSDAMIAHELGATIRGRAGKMLTIRTRAGARGNMGAMQKDARVAVIKGKPFLVIAKGVKGEMGGRRGYWRKIPIARLIRSVRLKAKLGFISSWDEYTAAALERFDSGVLEALRRTGLAPPATEDES